MKIKRSKDFKKKLNQSKVKKIPEKIEEVKLDDFYKKMLEVEQCTRK